MHNEDCEKSNKEHFMLWNDHFYSLVEPSTVLQHLAAAHCLTLPSFSCPLHVQGGRLFCDVASPDFHPLVKKSKDVAAGAVPLSAIGAVVIALIIFTPKIMVYIL